MSEIPLKFLAHYEADCGDSYELINFKLPSLKLYCEDCREFHRYKFVYLEHRVWEWKRVEEIWMSEGGVSDPYADND